MSAIIVQCPSCSARFHLAQERIPEKGARVRCSRCEHRFYVTSTGDVSESKPSEARSDGESGAVSGSRPAASSGGSSGASQPRPRKAAREAATTAMDALPGPERPGRSASLGGVAPQEDADLDDPQFLFDDSSSSSVELPYAPGALGLDDEDPSSAAFGDVSGSAAPRTPETDVTPREPPRAPPEPARPSAVANPGAGSWLSNDDEAIPDIRAQRDELVAQRSSATLADPTDAALEPGSDLPEPDAELAPPPAPSALRSEGRRSAQRETDPPAAAGRYAGTGGAVFVARSVSERPAREPSSGAEPPLSQTLERASTLVTLVTALALLFAGWHALSARLGPPAGPERVQLPGGAEVSSVEVLQLHDAAGHRVLAVRGLLGGAGGAARLQLRLIDASGTPIGEPHGASPGFLGDAELSSDRLGELLAPGGAAARAGDERGFTVLVRDPPLEAERFSLELAG